MQLRTIAGGMNAGFGTLDQTVNRLDPGYHIFLRERGSPMFQQELEFARAIVTEFKASGGLKPACPVGRHSEAIAMLGKMMVWPDLFEAYRAALEAARVDKDVNLDLLRRPVPEIPWDEIAEKGFEILAPDQIAEVMISPETLRALRDYIDEPETNRGPWFHRLVDHLV